MNLTPLTPRATFFLTLCLVSILSLVSYLPDGGFEWLPIKKVNIYSQLHSESALGDDLMVGLIDPIEPIELPIIVPSLPDVERFDTIVKDTMIILPVEDSLGNVLRTDTVMHQIETIVLVKFTPADSAARRDQIVFPDDLVPIEDYSADGRAMEQFYKNLSQANTMSRPVRIAVLGDSFIEGDIFTQDLRELMQDRFGGSGVGFVPVTSNVASFRRSVEHKFSGWDTHSIISRMSRGGYIYSSFTYTPADEPSVVSYKGTQYRKYLDIFSTARFMFINKGSSRIKAVVNGSQVHTYSPAADDRIAQIIVESDSIHSVSFSVENGAGFTAYGASLDQGSGVNVDNYSLRGNSGISLSSIDRSLTEQMARIAPVDLIILEYGLNVAQADVRNYTAYIAQMQRSIQHIRQCMPNVAIMVISIPDRTHRSGDGWVTMPGVQAMANAQRQLAKTTSVLYWSTLDAMRKRGGMSKFVTNGWAAKDYTHLSVRGGAQVAQAIFDSMMHDMKSRAL